MIEYLKMGIKNQKSNQIFSISSLNNITCDERIFNMISLSELKLEILLIFECLKLQLVRNS